jgi:hypothetical protein
MIVDLLEILDAMRLAGNIRVDRERADFRTLAPSA